MLRLTDRWVEASPAIERVPHYGESHGFHRKTSYGRTRAAYGQARSVGRRWHGEGRDDVRKRRIVRRCSLHRPWDAVVRYPPYPHPVRGEDRRAADPPT